MHVCVCLCFLSVCFLTFTAFVCTAGNSDIEAGIAPFSEFCWSTPSANPECIVETLRYEARVIRNESRININ